MIRVEPRVDGRSYIFTVFPHILWDLVAILGDLRYNRDRMLHQITLTAQCEPWKYDAAYTTRTISLTSAATTSADLPNGAGRLVPEIAISGDTILRFYDPYSDGWKTAVLHAPNDGTLEVLDRITVIKTGFKILSGGSQIIARMVSSSTGSIQLTYRKADL